GEQREERPFGDLEPRSDVQLLPQESPAYPGRAPAYAPSPTRRDDGQAASPAARRRLRARATRACASSSPSAEPSARFSAVRARSTSVSSASSAISARIEIRSPRVAAMKPPCTAARTSPVSRAPRMRTTEPGASSASTGTCPGWIPISPSTVLAMTMSPSPAQSSRSGVTSSTKSFFDTATTPQIEGRSTGFGGGCACTAAPSPRLLALQRLRLLDGHLDVADVQERLLGQVVVLAVADRLEGGDGLLQRHEHARGAGELL